MPTSPIRIALVDDQELFLEGLGTLLQTGNEVEVLWTASSGEEALLKAAAQPPDVVLMDYSFKDSNRDGGEITRLLVNERSETGVLMFSVNSELSVIRECLEKGARGYASKNIKKEELLRAIETVAKGDYYLDHTSLALVIKSFLRKMPKSPVTDREAVVGQLYIKGLKIRDIAEQLYISTDTVESHIKNLRSKLDASSRHDVEMAFKKFGLPLE